jgi:hypothetical protein
MRYRWRSVLVSSATAVVAAGAITFWVQGNATPDRTRPGSVAGASRATAPATSARGTATTRRERTRPASPPRRPTQRTASARPSYPAQVLDLTDWTLTLPVAAPDTTTAMEVDRLAAYRFAPYFTLSHGRNGVLFRAPVGGATTPGSSYPRSELREMTDGGARRASWSTTSGTHTLVVREATLHLPVVKPQVATAQIHSAADDVIQIVTDGTRSAGPGRASICMRLNGITQLPCLDRNYRLGTPYTIRMTAVDGHIRVFYNRVQRFDVAVAESGLYFKAGVYTQSNPDQGDAPAAFGAAVIYRLRLSH